MKTPRSDNDGCRWHEMPPGMTVWFKVGGNTFPLSAGLACESWHVSRYVRDELAELLGLRDVG